MHSEWFSRRFAEDQSLVAELRSETLAELLETDRAPLIVDVREIDEIQEGMIPGARHLPRSHLEMHVSSVLPELSRPVVLYCAAGVRSVLAARTLQELGYTALSSLAGGFGAWSRAGFPVARSGGLTAGQRERYARQLVLPGVGVEGQKRLLESRVLLVGAGGLGSVVALYLAAAGVGTLGIVDDDRVELSNLQRQVIHRGASVGDWKTASARRGIHDLNEDVSVEEHRLYLNEGSAAGLVGQYDLVVDGSDSIETRYAVNRAAIAAGRTVVHGSVYRFEGHVTALVPGVGPCYRCLFPHPPSPSEAPSCVEGGVLGVVPGLVGLLQATETLKLLLGIGEPLIGRLVVVDALGGEWTTIRAERDPECVECSSVLPHPE